MEAKNARNVLWTKNFTIITLGTVVSLLGNAISGVAISLLVYDFTQSTFLFALFMVTYNLPRVIMPLIAGPYLDTYSRKKVIYMLDFISSGLYMLIFVMLSNNIFHYGIFLILAFIIGSIDSVYQVAYESFYPTLISEGNYQRAYSISSMLNQLSQVMVPLALYLRDRFGYEPLFLINSISFFIGAVFETRIDAVEPQAESHTERFSVRKYYTEFKLGLSYINTEKGLQVITSFFFLSTFALASSIVVLPYFVAQPHLGEYAYLLVMGGGVIGRVIGGALQYRFDYPARKKLLIALIVYIITSLLDGSYLFFPIVAMIGISFVSGLLSATSNNIRIAGTQSYVPNLYRGRFNGSFQMICTIGTIAGQLVSGALADFIGGRLVVTAFMSIQLLGVFLIMLPGQKHLREIYNREA